MTSAPYNSPPRTPSAMVSSSEAPRIVTTSAPDFAAISTSNAPVSMIFMSATIRCDGNAFFSSRTASSPSLLISGVPASIQSAPPSTASFAAPNARERFSKSSATWRTGRSSRMPERGEGGV
jgi:hypothetical protein